MQEAAFAIVDAEAPEEFFTPFAQTTVPDDLFLQRLLLGQSILLLLPELGAEGPATVTAIDPLPGLNHGFGQRMFLGVVYIEGRG